MTAAIVLAGGRARRLGGVDKPLLEVAGRSLLARAVAAASPARPVVVVGPERPGFPDVRWTREDPPHGGPVAAIAAGLPLLGDAEEVLVLAADLPRAEEAVAALREAAALRPPDDGICLADASGRPQWLLALYRVRPLAERLARLPDGGASASVRALVDGMALSVVRAAPRVADDVDTWEDLDEARSGLAAE